MARALQGCRIEPLDAESARAAGRMLGACTVDVGATDATVVESTLRAGRTVVTSDRAHLEALAAGVNRRLDVIDI